jgi:hypothetical protein
MKRVGVRKRRAATERTFTDTELLEIVMKGNLLSWLDEKIPSSVPGQILFRQYRYLRRWRP